MGVRLVDHQICLLVSGDGERYFLVAEWPMFRGTPFLALVGTSREIALFWMIEDAP